MKTKLMNYIKNMSNTKRIALLGIIAIVFVCLVLTASYALFRTNVTGKTYTVKVGTFDIEFEDLNNNLIVLNNTYPMTNAQGIATTGYTFNVSNNGTVPGKYLVRLELADDNEIPIEYIKVAYQKTKDESETVATPQLSSPVLLSDLNSGLVILDSESLGVGKKDTINLKIWLDISAPNDVQNKSFKAKIVIDGTQDYADAGYQVDTKPVIELNKDENGNIDYIVPLNGTYTELNVASVRDDKDKLLPSDVTISGSVDTTTVGENTITYTVTDSDNNTTTVERTIYVGDEESLNIKHSIAQVLAMYTQAQQSANEAIMCSHIYGDGDMYLGCNIYDTLDNAIAARNRSTIILTKDLTRTSNIAIQSTKDITIDLNQKTITTTANTHNITLYGKLIIDNGSLINTSSEGTPSVICNQEGTLTTNSNLYIEGPYGIGCHTNTAITNVNGSEIKATKYNGINIGSTTAQANLNNARIISVNQNAIYNGNGTYNINGGSYESTSNNTIVNNGAGTINVNSGTFNANIYAIRNASSGTITINDGVFTSATSRVIMNDSTGIVNISGGIFTTESGWGISNMGNATLNINQNKRIYISSAGAHPTILNYGQMSVVADKANNCNGTIADTTSGLCVYSTVNSAVKTEKGTVSINGGSYVSNGESGIINESGNINIQNSFVKTTSGSYGAVTNGNYFQSQGTGLPGTINICSSTITGTTRDIYEANTGGPYITISDDNEFSNGTNVPDSNKVYGTITQVATCPF